MKLPAFAVAPPKLPKHLDELPPQLFRTGATLKHSVLARKDVSVRVAHGIDLRGCRFDTVNLANTKLIKLGACDVEFNHPDFTTSDCSDGSWLRVAVTDGRMTGWDANRSVLTDVTFKDCKCDMANFRASKLTRVRFVGCVLGEADFLGAELTDIAFDGCILEKAEFSQCKLTRVDLRDSQLTDLRGWEYLRGAVIDNVQLAFAAPYLAQAMGIIVEDEAAPGL